MKTHTLSWWKIRADNVYSKLIRRKNADKNGMCVCVTCRKIFHWKNIQNGHYIPRNHLSTRYDDRNCAPQCCGCNVYGGGKHDLFALALVSKYGPNILEDLNAQKNKKVKYKIYDYQEMIDKWTDELVGLDIRDGDL